MKTEIFLRYIEYMYNQVEEVCTNYGKIDIMWFDFHMMICGARNGEQQD